MTRWALEAREIRHQVRLRNGEILTLLQGVELCIAEGESVAIMGASGTGKSSLLAILGLMMQAESGIVRICGEDLSQSSDRHRTKLRNRHIGFVFQNHSLIHHLSAAQNVELPLHYLGSRGRVNRRQAVKSALSAVGLADRVRSRPRHLSGGEQQRVAIARALVTEPALILADEPTGALDKETAHDVLQVLFGSTRERGSAVVVVTHDPAVASRANRVLRLENGQLRQEREGPA